MNIKKYILLLSVGLMAVSCKDKIEVEPQGTPAQEGDEVIFGAALDANAVSRTIYGIEVGEGTTNDYFPINWVKGDQVIVASPQCSRTSGTYKVPDAADNQPSAGTLNRVGSAGVQWGSANVATFYSIYPQREAPYNVTTQDCSTFTLNMPQVQTCLVAGKTPKMTTADMYACFMYAKSTVDRTTTNVVNLHYTPLSTAIRFKLKGSGSSTTIINRIDLVGPTALSGKFEVDLSGSTPKVTLTSDTSHVVTVFARYENEAYLQLSNNQTIELNAFIIPQENQKIDNTWYIKVTLADGKQFIKNLGGTQTTGHTMNLAFGQIHRLPDLPAITAGAWKNEDWMRNIPRNVYLSEISIPGSWSSLNDDYQEGINTIGTKTTGQYSKGCRAFHLDTRYKWTDRSHTASLVELSVATGGQSTYTEDGKALMDRSNLSFSEYLKQITDQVQPNEYMVLLCTFALDSYQKTGTTWYKDVSDACASNTKVVNALGFDSSYYDERTGIALNEDTMVGDVLGKVIVILGCSSEELATLGESSVYATSPCLFSNMSLTRKESNFKFTSVPKFNQDDLYYGDGEDSGIVFNNTIAQISYGRPSSTGSSWPAEGVDMTGSAANRGYAPSLIQRIEVMNNIFAWSATNYSETDYAHDAWIFLGLGGYTTASASVVITYFDYQYEGIVTYLCNNNENDQQNRKGLNTKINKMAAVPESGQTNYFPVGIALLNRVGMDTSQTTITNVLQLNSKFHKDFNPNFVAFDYSKPDMN